MDLYEFKQTHNFDDVFNLIDTVNQASEEFKIHIRKHSQRVSHWQKRFKEIFYYIFIHNISCRLVGHDLNNEYGFLICPAKNFAKITDQYRKCLDFLAEKHLIYYPIKGYISGKVKVGQPANIIKPVRIDRDLIKNYSDEQLELITTYLTQDDDPEGIMALCKKIGFMDEKECRQFYAVQSMKKNPSTQDYYHILDEINNKHITLSEYEKSLLNNTNYTDFLKQSSYEQDLIHRLEKFSSRCFKIFYEEEISNFIKYCSFTKYKQFDLRICYTNYQLRSEYLHTGFFLLLIVILLINIS